MMMKNVRLFVLGALVAPMALAAQQPAVAPAAVSKQPVVDAVKEAVADLAKDLQAAADTVPVSLLSYKPTKEQLSFADIWNHLAGANYALCALFSGTPAPAGSPNPFIPRDTTKTRADLVAALKASFTFCDAALAKTDDSKLGDMLPVGGRSFSRARALLIYAMDLEDHYSQVANYMRLNNMLPPSAIRQQAAMRGRGRGGN
jgi:hypothetical protein